MFDKCTNSNTKSFHMPFLNVENNSFNIRHGIFEKCFTAFVDKSVVWFENTNVETHIWCCCVEGLLLLFLSNLNRQIGLEEWRGSFLPINFFTILSKANLDYHFQGGWESGEEPDTVDIVGMCPGSFTGWGKQRVRDARGRQRIRLGSSGELLQAPR